MIDLECIDNAKNGRFYKDEDGNYYPSVTTKLGKVVTKGEGLMRWYAKQDSYQDAQDYMNQRGQEGTNVHEACESLLYGGVVETDGLRDNSIRRIQGFINFWQNYYPKVYNTEFVVRSKEWKYAGRVDLLLGIEETDTDFALVDIKTSKGIYESHKLQLMFYLYALEEMGVTNADNTTLYVLLLKHRTKKGYQLKEIDYYPEMVVNKNQEYNHEFSERCDMRPKFKEELPKRFQLDPDKVEELNATKHG